MIVRLLGLALILGTPAFLIMGIATGEWSEALRSIQVLLYRRLSKLCIALGCLLALPLVAVVEYLFTGQGIGNASLLGLFPASVDPVMQFLIIGVTEIFVLTTGIVIGRKAKKIAAKNDRVI